MNRPNPEISIEPLDPSDGELIETIAGWYDEEWNAPVEKTVRRLTRQPDEDTLFQLVVYVDDKAVATGGLCNEVNLYNVHERFKAFRPWVGLLYTEEAHRRRGYGTMLLEEIERRAREIGLDTIYLYTFTAESMYKRCGWTEMDRVPYKEHDTAVMQKSL